MSFHALIDIQQKVKVFQLVAIYVKYYTSPRWYFSPIWAYLNDRRVYLEGF